ncbi:hypothetical protein Nepgr_026969 [Nepenthes gracilis]|uniref:Prolamin-like domain-containing protein n=1 Tax=Nepenthes gracilis TaxID=150966 RepID=A0AAD3Y330_NEPGR|nr:hypothetical protein Nepgr_026969 [Nepenthes gracilis]
MASSSNTLLTILAWALLALSTSAPRLQARPLGPEDSTLPSRLRLDESTNCWNSLFELQSCTGEVIQFFYNGETYLGPNCCRAIRIIEHNCWPALLGSLGFTPEEGAILRGYCDAEEESSSSLSESTSTSAKPAAIDPLHLTNP